MANSNPDLIREAERYIQSLLNRVTPEALAESKVTSLTARDTAKLEDLVTAIRSAKVTIPEGT